MAELAYAQDLGSCTARCEGSTPSGDTINMSRRTEIKKLLSVIGIILDNRHDVSFQEFFSWAQKVIEMSPGVEDLSNGQVISALQLEFTNKFRKGNGDTNGDSCTDLLVTSSDGV